MKKPTIRVTSPLPNPMMMLSGWMPGMPGRGILPTLPSSRGKTRRTLHDYWPPGEASPHRLAVMRGYSDQNSSLMRILPLRQITTVSESPQKTAAGGVHYPRQPQDREPKLSEPNL